LPSLHQLRHGADRVLDRHGWVDAVLVEQVDDIGAEPLQRGLGHGLDMLGPAVDADHRRRTGFCGVELEAEFGGDDDTVAHGLQRLAEKFFIVEGAVGFGRVEQRDAEVDGAMQRPRRFGIVLRAIGEAHAHAAEADGRNGEIFSEFAGFHRCAP
jgi:hypothetical protein